jgi:hypothetical protein
MSFKTKWRTKGKAFDRHFCTSILFSNAEAGEESAEQNVIKSCVQLFNNTLESTL